MQGQPAVVSAASESSLTLAQRIVDGDRSAEDELVKTYWRGVLLIANVRTRDRDAAHDLAQETLMAVLTALRKGQLRDPGKLAGFIQGTARNIINNYFGNRTRRAECELDPEQVRIDPVGDLELAERQRLVRKELAACSPVDQQILLLSLVDGHSLAEVAQRLNMSYEAVRARKSRMVKKIIKKFARVSQK
jgi:RNA polymerase sigma-70 factor, ECF subfamily